MAKKPIPQASKQTHSGRADQPSPSSFKAEMYKGSKPGEWRGKYVPVPPSRKK